MALLSEELIITDVDYSDLEVSFEVLTKQLFIQIENSDYYNYGRLSMSMKRKEATKLLEWLTKHLDEIEE